MNEKAARFYEVVSADEALQAELAAATEAVALEDVTEEEARENMAQTVAAFAAEHDLDLTAADILAADTEAAEGELSEEELASIAGGSKCLCVIIGAVKGCGCVFSGAAVKDHALGCSGFGMHLR